MSDIISNKTDSCKNHWGFDSYEVVCKRKLEAMRRVGEVYATAREEQFGFKFLESSSMLEVITKLV